MGRRVQKIVYGYGSGSWQLEKEILFVYDGWNVIKEITRQGGSDTIRYFVWGLDLSQSLQGAGGVGGLLAMVDGTNTYHYCFDANGNVGQLVNDTNGEIAAHYEFDPFGNVVRQIGSMAGDNPFRFSTKYFDDETELYSYIFRYYSTQLGRWINRDPIGEYGGSNRYAQSYNDPINYYDPSGLSAESDWRYYYNEKKFFADPRVKSKEWFYGLHQDTKEAMKKAWSIERYKKLGGGVNPYLEHEFNPDFSELINSPYIGVEGHFIAGGGLSLVTCCDEKENKHYFLFAKGCFGPAIGGGVSAGAVAGMDKEKCKYENYEGWFFEAGGSIAFVGAGVDVGVTESDTKIPLIDIPLPSTDFSGVIEGGAGPSCGKLEVKATWCRYKKVWDKEVSCGCKKKEAAK